MKTRLDAELVRRELARSRESAVELIQSKKVIVNGMLASKPATQVDSQTSITVKDDIDKFVSRGGNKLAGALDHFTKLQVNNKVALDAGASTGGFTQVLLKRGAKQVIAVDVGYGQLAWQLQKDDRVVILDRVNVRTLTKEQIQTELDLIVADLSFISLKTVLPALIEISNQTTDFLLMVKPQFEVGKDRIGAGGVVRDLLERKLAVQSVADAAFSKGLGCFGVVASQLPGPSGNVEYFLWLNRAAPALLEVDLDLAIEKGPK